MSGVYSSRIFECPFFRWDRKGEVHCEGGVVSLPPKELLEYMNKYCGSIRGYHDCPIAMALFDYYERMERKEQKNEKH